MQLFLLEKLQCKMVLFIVAYLSVVSFNSYRTGATPALVARVWGLFTICRFDMLLDRMRNIVADPLD